MIVISTTHVVSTGQSSAHSRAPLFAVHGKVLMMENYLKEINGVLGVVGSFVCLSDGTIPACAMPAIFDAPALETVGRVAAQTFNALETSRERIADLDLTYAQRRLIFKNVRGGILGILCERTVNVGLLNLSVKAAAKKIEAELKAARAAPATVPSPVAIPDVDQPTAPPTVESIPGSPSAAAQEPGPSSASLPGEIVDAQFFLVLTRELARFMGPAAQFLVEDEISALKERREAFPKASAPLLVERLSMTIRDAGKRGKFTQTMSAIKL